MSAISAVWSLSDEPVAGKWHNSMLSALREHGPDRTFSWNNQYIGLGVNVFSTLPEDRLDLQPQCNVDQSVRLIADVRLDNRADLVRELGLTRPEQLPDSYFLLAAWLRWGAACLDYLLGAFAFAVWMPQSREIFAARDHTGERPLYYHHGDRYFALASMPKGLLALPGFDRTTNESSAARWVACSRPDWTTSFFKEIQRLPPGSFLRVTPSGLETKQYWHPTQAKPTRFRRDEDYAEALVEILDSATEARLRSDKPIGSLLSAGLDSSSVTASAARLLAQRNRQLVAFTAIPRPGFSGEERTGYFASEADGAAEIARLYPNINHVIVDSRGHEFVAVMKRWTDAMDEPALNIVNLLWLSAIFANAKGRGISVLLEGAEGNTTLSYNSWNVLRELFWGGRWRKLARIVYGLHRSDSLRITSAARIASTWLSPRWLTRRREHNRLHTLASCLANPGWFEKYDLRNQIFETFYPQWTGVLEEHSSMFDGYDHGQYRAGLQAATQVEVRDPTADKRLFEFCFSIPHEQYLADGLSRSLVRRAMKDRLPESTLARQRRGLQGADWYSIMAESFPELRRELKLIAQSPTASAAVDVAQIEQLLDNWPKSGFHTEAVYAKWHFWLARALSLGYFLRTHEPSDLKAASIPSIAAAHSSI